MSNENNPDRYIKTFCEMLNGYLRPIVMRGEELKPADALAILDLSQTAHLACGNFNMQILASKGALTQALGEHVQGVIQAGEAAKAEAERGVVREDATPRSYSPAPDRFEVREGDSVPDNLAPGTLLVDPDGKVLGVIDARGLVKPGPEWG